MSKLASVCILLFFLVSTNAVVQAQWVQSSSPNFVITSFAFSGTSLFAGTSSGVLLTTNNGTSWSSVNNGIVYTSINALAASGSTVFAAGTGTYVTSNNGASWSELTIGTPSSKSSLAVIGGTVFAGTDGGGVFRSSNGGANWTAVNSGLVSNSINALVPSGSTLYSGTNAGVFVSISSGGVWTALNNGLPGGFSGFVTALAINGSTLYAGTNGSGVFLSTNSGSNWAAINNGLANQYVYSIAISGTNLFAATDLGVFLSMDNGASWTAFNTGLGNLYSKVLAVNSSYIFCGTAQGVWRRPLSDVGTSVQPPSAPTLLSPSNGSTGVSAAPTFSWNASSGATSYRLQVSTNSGFSTTVIDQSSIANTSQAVTGLANNTLYYWRVNATNNGGTSNWSTAWSFTTVQVPVLPPSAPTLLTPANGSTGVSTTPTLSWNVSGGATSYELQVSTNPSFSTTVFDQSSIANTSQLITGLANNTFYYWRVDATNNGGTSNWSTPWSFTTVQAPVLPPSTPALLAPADGASNVSAIPTLIWNASIGATSYRLQVSTNSSFSTTTFDQSNITGTLQQIFGLTRNTLYYWRVNASNAGGSSSNSPVRSFSTGSIVQLYYDRDTTYLAFYVPLPNSEWVIAHRLTSPSTNVNIIKLSYLYTGDYAGKDGAFFPVVYFASTSTPNVPAANAVYVGPKSAPTFGWTDVDVSSQGLSLSAATGTDFFVGVKFDGSAQPAIGWGAEKNDRSWYYNPGTAQWYRTDGTLFIRATIAVITDVEQAVGKVPKRLILEQNYPNPFNPATTIRYELPKAAIVTLKIFNTFGQLVATLTDEHKEAGYYEVLWNANVATGVYYYRLQAGQFVETKKLILLR